MKSAPRSSPLRAVAMAAVVAALFTAVGVFHTFVRLAVTEQAYLLSKVEGENRSLARENEQLRAEFATLKSPSRIEPIARSQGLDRPAPGQIIRVDGALRTARADANRDGRHRQ
jgi:cell division protein FtsL